jgi:hypothetical protein
MISIKNSLIYILILSPVLFYTGYLIYYKQIKNPFIIYVILGLAFLVLIYHFFMLIKFFKNYQISKTYNKSIGLVLILLSLIILVVNGYLLFVKNLKDKKVIIKLD